MRFAMMRERAYIPQMVCPSPPLLFSFFSAFHGERRRHDDSDTNTYLFLYAQQHSHPNPMTPSLSRYFSHSRKDHLCPPRSTLPPARPHDRVRRSSTPQPIFLRAVKWYIRELCASEPP